MKSPILEEQAKEDLDGIFHEIRQVFRVSGVNLNFRTWAAYPRFFPVLWEAIRPVAESRIFEESPDQFRVLADICAEVRTRDTTGAGDALPEHSARHSFKNNRYIRPLALPWQQRHMPLRVTDPNPHILHAAKSKSRYRGSL